MSRPDWLPQRALDLPERDREDLVACFGRGAGQGWGLLVPTTRISFDGETFTPPGGRRPYTAVHRSHPVVGAHPDAFQAANRHDISTSRELIRLRQCVRLEQEAGTRARRELNEHHGLVPQRNAFGLGEPRGPQTSWGLKP